MVVGQGDSMSNEYTQQDYMAYLLGYDTKEEMHKELPSTDPNLVPIELERTIGENVIKAEAILSAWLKYCRESRIYRILEFLGLK